MKTKNQNMKRVCIVHLSIPTIHIFTHGSKHTLNYGYLILLDDLHLQGDSVQKLRDPRASAMYHHDARALESPCESFQTPLLKLITY